ncbi:MAG: electron transport complex subunit RsxA [Clostridia bacterium]|nr:electron transport complex subunit RsxA [Oscillospiraceae bacterium]MBQ2749835.1 electron transport complex subunit RsxA [Clostridia bacterium]MBQ4623525.1 electron transport complex subunit RsxA [Clostridia bacterium]MBQ6990544.1 electron transport complex subunit RsxA [Clostridia bacterium]MBR6764393.1 electron transport complex subunit RsxA [Clostridia bacterium]
MTLTSIFALSVGAVLVNNFVLVKFLGICPFMGTSKRTDTAVSMGVAVTFVMTAASMLTWFFNDLFLIPFELEYLQTIVFILVIASLVQLVEMVLRKLSPPLYSALGIYLPLITTNCAVLGVALLNIQEGYNFLESTLNGFMSGVGFLLALVLFSGVRERMAFADCPKPFRGLPIALIAASLLAMAFMGFSGLKIG